MPLTDRHPIEPPMGPLPQGVAPVPNMARPASKPLLAAIQGGPGVTGEPLDTRDTRDTPAIRDSGDAGGKSAASVTPAVTASTARDGSTWQDLMDSRSARFLMGVISIGSVLLAWYLATKYRLDFYIRFGNIPTPADVWEKVLEVNRSAKFVVNVGISLRRVLIGFLLAGVIGVFLGILIGRYRVFRALTMPALEVFRPIPAIAWVPMAIMLWPSNEVSIVFITFLGAFFPILLNTIHGVEEIDEVLFRAARSLGTREKDLIMYVVIPGALQHIFTGLAVGMGVAWVSLIAAEMISGQFGIGYFTWEAYSLISYAEIALGMITIGILGLICSKAIQICSKLATPWIGSAAGGARK
jgi:NitT/TauT family transport system permease protein